MSYDIKEKALYFNFEEFFLTLRLLTYKMTTHNRLLYCLCQVLNRLDRFDFI